MDQSEFDEAYEDDSSQQEHDERRLGEAILNSTLAALDPKPAVAVGADTTIRDAIRMMLKSGIGAVLVLDDRGRVTGIFTERDVLRLVATSAIDPSRPVSEAMTGDPVCLGLDDGIAFALNRMILGGFRHIPIIDDAGLPLAVLSLRDVVAFLVALLPARVLNLPPEPGLEARSSDGG